MSDWRNRNMSNQASANPQKPHFEVVIPGDYFCDIIFTGVQGLPEVGKEVYTDDVNVVIGGTLNSVLALRRLGVNIGWMGALGTDFFSHLIEHSLRDEGLDLTLVERLDHALRRVTVALSYPHDRAFITYCEPSDASFEGWFKLLDRATFNHLHLPGLTVDKR